jgi:hypothetical protein
MFFLEAILCVFCGVFHEKSAFDCGFLLVSLWWNRGELRSVDSYFLGLENLPQILNLFFWVPILVIPVAQEAANGTDCRGVARSHSVAVKLRADQV